MCLDGLLEQLQPLCVLGLEQLNKECWTEMLIPKLASVLLINGDTFIQSWEIADARLAQVNGSC